MHLGARSFIWPSSSCRKWNMSLMLGRILMKNTASEYCNSFLLGVWTVSLFYFTSASIIQQEEQGSFLIVLLEFKFPHSFKQHVLRETWHVARCFPRECVNESVCIEVERQEMTDGDLCHLHHCAEISWQSSQPCFYSSYTGVRTLKREVQFIFLCFILSKHCQ